MAGRMRCLAVNPSSCRHFEYLSWNIQLLLSPHSNYYLDRFFGTYALCVQPLVNLIPLEAEQTSNLLGRYSPVRRSLVYGSL